METPDEVVDCAQVSQGLQPNCHVNGVKGQAQGEYAGKAKNAASEQARSLRSASAIKDAEHHSGDKQATAGCADEENRCGGE